MATTWETWGSTWERWWRATRTMTRPTWEAWGSTWERRRLGRWWCVRWCVTAVLGRRRGTDCWRGIRRSTAVAARSRGCIVVVVRCSLPSLSWTISPRPFPRGSRTPEEALSLSHNWYIRGVALDLVLELVGLIIGKGALRRRCTTLGRESNILVVSHSVLAETLNYRMLVRNLADPVFHALHHLPLHLRVVVMEFWVEPGDPAKVSKTIERTCTTTQRTNIEECPR